MDDATIRALAAINRRFYDENAASFIAKRQRPWRGWRRLLEQLPEGARVLDVGCGHGRFLAFLEAEAPDPSRAYVGIDACRTLLDAARARWPADPPTFLEVDVLDDDLRALGRFDLVVAFGLLHHVPGAETRRALAERLAAAVAAGGHLVLALWAVDPSGEKHTPPSSELDVEPGDMLLGWGPNPDAQRYCHDIDDDEAARLVRASGLELVYDYRADGAGDRNRYLVLRR